MPTYPTFAQAYETHVVRDDGIEQSVALNGDVRGRQFHSNTKYSIEVVHPSLSDADFLTLLTFFNTNKLLANDVIARENATTYTNLLFRPSKEKPIEWWRIESKPTGRRWRVVTKLRSK